MSGADGRGGRRPVGLVATDLDGTLLGSDHTLGPRDEAALRALGRAGVVRVVATGRSRWSAERVLAPDFPIDYLVFSSGAGIVDWKSGRLLARHSFEAGDAARAARALRRLGLDFMVHAPVPHSHRFRYVRSRPRAANADFDRRIERYGEFARPWEEGTGEGEEEERAGEPPAAVRAASQFVAILDASEAAVYEEVRAALPGLAVIRCTSPLDGRSVWIEVFPPGVGKGSAVAWLAARHRLGPAETAAVGNDYNDADMLEWSRFAFAVGNAAPELRERYRVVSSNDAGGFSDAVDIAIRDGGGSASTPADE